MNEPAASTKMDATASPTMHATTSQNLNATASQNLDATTSQNLGATPNADINATADSFVGNKNIWSEPQVKLLLAAYDDLRPKVGKNFAPRNESRMWHQIQKTLAKEGYVFSAAQIENKIRTLERRYKVNRLHNTKTGRIRMVSPFESELEKVFRDNRGVTPQYQAMNSSSEDLSDSDASPSNRALSSSGVEDSELSFNQNRIIQLLERMAKRDQEQHNEMMQLLKKSKEINLKGYELFDKLLNKLNKTN